MPTWKRALFSILLALPAAAGALERTDLLPVGSPTYVRISNAADFFSRLADSPFGRLWNDPQFRAFMGQPAGPGPFAGFDGEVVLIYGDGKEATPGVVAAMSAEAYRQRFPATNETEKAEAVRRVPGGGERWQAFANGTFVEGSDRKWVEQCLARLKNEKIREPAGPAVLDLHLPMGALIDRWVEKMDGSTDTSTRALVDALGLGGIEDLLVTVEPGTETMEIRADLAVDDLSKGVFGLLNRNPAPPPQPPSFLPASLGEIECARVNPSGLWKQLPGILGSLSTNAPVHFSGFLGLFEQQTGVDIGKDLVGNAGGLLLSFSATDGRGDTVTATALQLRDAAAFQSAIEAILASPSLKIQSSGLIERGDYLGCPVYAARTYAPAGQKLFAIVDGYLLQAPPALLGECLRNAKEEGAAPTLFNELEKRANPNALACGAIDWKQRLPPIFRKLEDPATARKIGQAWNDAGIPLPVPDFSRLPPASHVAACLNLSRHELTTTGKGLRLRMRWEYPGKRKPAPNKPGAGGKGAADR